MWKRKKKKKNQQTNNSSSATGEHGLCSQDAESKQFIQYSTTINNNQPKRPQRHFLLRGRGDCREDCLVCVINKSIKGESESSMLRNYCMSLGRLFMGMDVRRAHHFMFFPVELLVNNIQHFSCMLREKESKTKN